MSADRPEPPSADSTVDRIDCDLDLRGLKCPLPALKTDAALGRLEAGKILRVVTTDPMSVVDIPNLARQRGDNLIGQERQESDLVFIIRKKMPRSAE
jgi:tRNA 2-thiouridine synthesizing protein A